MDIPESVCFSFRIIGSSPVATTEFLISNMEILSFKPVQFTGIGLPFENLNWRCFHVFSPVFKDLFPEKKQKGSEAMDLWW